MILKLNDVFVTDLFFFDGKIIDAIQYGKILVNVSSSRGWSGVFFRMGLVATFLQTDTG